MVLSADWKVVGSLVLGSALAVSWGDAGVAGALGGGAERGVPIVARTVRYWLICNMAASRSV